MKNARSSFKNLVNEADFYHLAFALAQSNGTLEDIDIIKHKTNASGYLEPELEEIYFDVNNSEISFSTKKITEHDEVFSFDFSKKQALDFHKKILALKFSKEKHNFFLRSGKREHIWSICDAKLFWSYRLKNKSQQKRSGLDLGIKYFSAQIKTKEKFLDVLYWLRYDMNNTPFNGEFIHVKQNLSSKEAIDLVKVCSI